MGSGDMKTIKIKNYRLNADNIVGYWPVDEDYIRFEYVHSKTLSYLPYLLQLKSKETRDDALRVIDDFMQDDQRMVTIG